MDELFWAVVLVLIVAVFWATAFMLIAGAALVAVLVATLLVIPFGIGVVEGVRETKRKARDSNPEGS